MIFPLIFLKNLYNTTYISCKYNTSHVIHKDEYEFHIERCPDKHAEGDERKTTHNCAENGDKDDNLVIKNNKKNNFLVENIIKYNHCTDSNIHIFEKKKGNLQMKYFQYKIEDLKLKELSN